MAQEKPCQEQAIHHELLGKKSKGSGTGKQEGGLTVPNRIIKESICTSDNLASLSAEAERLFYRLMTQCDDFGLMLANPSIVKNRCFQLTSDAIKEKQMISWLSELENAGLIFFYEVDGKRYLKYTKWESHQQRRAQTPKYPLPEQGSEIMISDDIRCKQAQADVHESSNRDKRTRVVNESSKRGKVALAAHVNITQEEKDGLIDKHGQEAFDWMVQRLEDYKESTGKTYKSDAAAIRSWVASAWEDEKKRRGIKNEAIRRSGTDDLENWSRAGGNRDDDGGSERRSDIVPFGIPRSG